jgi:hypothetical protein
MFLIVHSLNQDKKLTFEELKAYQNASLRYYELETFVIVILFEELIGINLTKYFKFKLYFIQFIIF